MDCFHLEHVLPRVVTSGRRIIIWSRLARAGVTAELSGDTPIAHVLDQI